MEHWDDYGYYEGENSFWLGLTVGVVISAIVWILFIALIMGVLK